MFRFIRNLYLDVEWILKKGSDKSFHDSYSERYPSPYLCLPKRIKFRNFAWATVTLPLGGFIFCVLWSLWSDFDSATNTHCKAKNFLPSISAAVGHSKLSENVWKLCIGLHASPRLFVAFMYYQYLSSIVHRQFLKVVRIACFLNVAENMALVGLTFITSNENYEWHKRFFIIFIISFESYTLLMCGLLKRYRRFKPSKLELQSLHTKCQMMVIQVFSLVVICYTFDRHNKYCEDFMYTIFAFFEYIVVLTNIGFHMTAYWDFYDRVLSLNNTSHEENSRNDNLSLNSGFLLPKLKNYSIDINEYPFNGVIYK